MDSHEIETLVGELETRVDRLRSLYEQYFMGIERMAPAVPHKDVERRIQVMRKEQIRNTAVRFRFQMILQRYNTYQTHWQRICRQIEEGTYKRHLLRAHKKFDAAPSEPPPPISAPPASIEVVFEPEPEPTDDFAELDPIINAPAPAAPAASAPAAPKPPGAVRPVWRKVEPKPAPVAAPAPAPAPPARPPPPLPAAAKPAPAPPPPPLPKKPTAPGDLSDDRLRALYSQYVQTRRSQNESTAAITYDAMAKSLRESSAKLRDKHGKPVDFEVTVKEGKTILKPVVKKQP